MMRTNLIQEKNAHLSTAMTSALDISPAVNIVPPRLPFPVFSSGRSPLEDRRIAKKRLGISIENNEGLALSTKVFIGTSVSASATESAASAFSVHEVTVMAAVA
mmetsp:Transcript_5240/g.10317  ORF Transcript_5240/g.10317 Transcript_5240/m.10317 type:complete len:104 (+) Transcript_5240:607-918(+)